MSQRLQIPRSALIETIIKGQINQGPNKGKEAVIKIWYGWYSKGYKSDYQQILTKYVESFIEGQPRVAWSYTGRRLKDLAKEIKDIRHLITETA